MHPETSSLQRQIAQLNSRLNRLSALNQQLTLQLNSVESQLQAQRERVQEARSKAEQAQRGREESEWERRRQELQLRRVQEQLKTVQSLVSQESQQERTKLKDQNQRLKAIKPIYQQLQVIWLEKQQFLESSLLISHQQADSLRRSILQLNSLQLKSHSLESQELNRQSIERAEQQKRLAEEQLLSLTLKLEKTEARLKQLQEEKVNNNHKTCNQSGGSSLPSWSLDLCLESSLFKLKDKYSKLHRAQQILKAQHERLKRELKSNKNQGVLLKERLAESINRTLAYEQKWHQGECQKEKLKREYTELKAMMLSQNEYLQSDKQTKIQLLDLLQRFIVKSNEEVQIIEDPPVDWLFEWPQVMKNMIRFHSTHSQVLQRLNSIQQSYKEMQIKTNEKNIQATFQLVKTIKESKLLQGLNTHTDQHGAFLSELIQVNTNLQKDLFSLGRKNAQLQSQNKSLEDFSGELRASIQSYEKLLQDKNSKNKQLLEVLQRVFRQFQTLKNSFSQSAFEKDRLQSHLHSLQRHVHLLTTTDSAKDSTIISLKHQNHKLRQEVNQCNGRIERLLMQKAQAIQKPIERADSEERPLQTCRLNSFIQQQSKEIQRLSNLLRSRQPQQQPTQPVLPTVQKEEGLSRLVRIFAEREQQFLRLGKSNSNLFRRMEKIHQLLQLKLKQLEELKESQEQRRKASRQEAKKELERERQDVRELLDSDRLYKSLSGFLEWARASKRKSEMAES